MKKTPIAGILACLLLMISFSKLSAHESRAVYMLGFNDACSDVNGVVTMLQSVDGEAPSCVVGPVSGGGQQASVSYAEGFSAGGAPFWASQEALPKVSGGGTKGYEVDPLDHAGSATFTEDDATNGVVTLAPGLSGGSEAAERVKQWREVIDAIRSGQNYDATGVIWRDGVAERQVFRIRPSDDGSRIFLQPKDALTPPPQVHLDNEVLKNFRSGIQIDGLIESQ